MEKLQSGQFTVMIVPPATSFGPVDGRKYTMKWSEEGNAQVLTIETANNMLGFNTNKGDQLRLEWMPKLGEYVLVGIVYMDEGHENEERVRNRYNQWKTSIPEMLSFIIQSDFALFQHVPWLLDAPILVQFNSVFEQYSKLINFGTPRNYLFNRN